MALKQQRCFVIFGDALTLWALCISGRSFIGNSISSDVLFVLPL
jgi:hypothetical protein